MCCLILVDVLFLKLRLDEAGELLLEEQDKLGLSDALNASIQEAEGDLAALKATAAKERPRGRVLLHPTAIQATSDRMLETLQKDPLSARELLAKHAGTLVFTPTADGYKWEGGFAFEGLPATPAEGHSAGSEAARAIDSTEEHDSCAVAAIFGLFFSAATRFTLGAARSAEPPA